MYERRVVLLDCKERRLRFLANENIPLASVKKLQGLFDLKSVMLEKSGIKDSEVLEWAHTENRVILTFDRDYGELLFRHDLPRPGGVLYFRFEPKYPEELYEMVMSILESGMEINGTYSVVERDRIRQRKLEG